MYFMYDFYGDEMWILALFLESDFSSGWQTYKKWAKGESGYKKYNDIEGNISFLERKNNNIIITYIYDTSKDPYDNAFVIDKDQFIWLLEQ